MPVQIELGGRIVSKSQNLRGLLDYARAVSPVARVELLELPKNAGSLRVIFGNGAAARTNFLSFAVMQDWLKARRSWNDYKLFINGEPAK